MTTTTLMYAQRLARLDFQFLEVENALNKVAFSPDSSRTTATQEEKMHHLNWSLSDLAAQINSHVHFLMPPVKNALLQQIKEIKKRSDFLQEKLFTCRIPNILSDSISSLDNAFKRIDLDNIKNLETLDLLKTRNLQILSQPHLTSYQLMQTLDLNARIEYRQMAAIAEKLRDLNALVVRTIYLPENERANNLPLIRKELEIKLPSYCNLGRDVRNEIYKKIWILGDRQPDDFSWGEKHALDDLFKLTKAINSQPLFSFAPLDEGYANLNQFESEDEVADSDSLTASSESEHEDSSEVDLRSKTRDPVRSVQVTHISLSDLLRDFAKEEEIEERKINLLELKGLITSILNISDFSTEKKESEINKARFILDHDARNTLDEIFYQLSPNPEKGGEGWGGLNCAKDPKTLIKAIDFQIESLRSFQSPKTR